MIKKQFTEQEARQVGEKLGLHIVSDRSARESNNFLKLASTPLFMGCTFCEIYHCGKGIVYESRYFFARFDRFPVAPGHAEVIPKRHVVSLFDLTQDEWGDMQYALPDVVRQIEQTDFRQLYQEFVDHPLDDKSLGFCKKMLDHVGTGKKPDAYNIGINEGEAAGRTIHHLHIHIMPRFFDDVEDYVGGVRHIIPGMGNYKK